MDRDDLDFDDIIDNLMLSELSDRESSEIFEQVVENVLFPNGLLIPEELIVENLPRELVDGEFFVTLSGELIPYDDYIDVLGLMGSEPIDVVTTLPFTGGGASRPFVLGDVGPTSDLSDLLPPTALQFTIPEEREFDPFFDEENDTPSLTVALSELLAVDETDVGPTVDGVFAAPLTGMSAGSVLDVDSDFGADGAGSLVYGLSLSGGGVTALTTAVGDFVITLVENPDGSISGTYVDGLGVTQTAFDISIDAGTGVLSYSQYVALEHGDTSDHNDSFDLSGLGITASATVTDSDGDSDSDSVDVGGQITIFDDGPVITSVSASNGFNVDETDVGPTVDGVFAAPLTGMSAGSVLDVDSDFGADGAGSLVYGLSLSGGGVTALTTAVGDFVITLVENPDGSISGTYVDGLGVTQTAFDISIDAGTGVLSYSQYVALEHGDTSDHNDSFDLSGLGITASATVTDSDGDSDSDSVDVGGQITIFDDGPVITSVSASNGFNVDETDVGPTVDGVFAAPLTGMSAGSVLDVDSDFGADGAGSLVYGLSLSGGGVTALTTAVGDFVITLVENPDGSISGTYVDGLGVTQTAFDISIDAGTGVLSYSQYVALEHGDTSDHNDSFDLSGLGITASATVTDSDGDSDSDSVDVGGQITIFDDGPVITSVSASNGFNVDETDVGPTVDGVFAAPLTGMSAGSVLDVDSDFGADGAGSLVYGLSLSGGGVTALTTAVGDFVITLVENPDGSISGTYVDGLGVTQTAFDISIDAGTGVLSYSQYVALEHGDTSDHNDSFDLSGLGITASATVTDSDGDSDSDSVDVGGQITIFDDGPVITSVSASNGFNVDETDVGPTVDGVFAAPLTGMSAGSVLDVDSDFGADGAGSLVYGLSLSGGGVTALTTAVGDFVITLVENPDGSISGTYVDGLGVTQTAFDISIDAGTGVLSYSQYVALEHGDTSDHNDSFDLSGLGITASATVTDSDGDSDSDSVDVGGQITIFDDGPVITSVSASNGFNVDETDVGPTVDGVFAAPLTGMSAGSVLDVDSDFGADGAGSLVYGLSLSGGGVTALTTAVGDFVITLVENPDGSISGTYVDGLGVTQTAFDISIDAGTGVLSYSQYVALEHGDTSDHNDSFDLSGLGITASATVTDSDGDSDSDSVDVGGQITIFDDGPVITSVSASNGFNVDETDVGPTVDGVFAAPLTGMSAGSVLDVDSDFGADGAGSLVYGLSLSGGGVTALTTAVGDFVITLVENPDGSISGTYVDGLGVTQTAFDISIDAGTGVLSYSQYVALEHGDTSDHNDSFDLSGLGITASATVTDSDGDSDSDSVDVGGQITIFDDGPVITSVSASNGFNVDETDVGPTVDGVFAAPLTGMSAGSVLDVDSDFGADGAGSLVYGLSLSGGGVTALTTAVGDFVITLVENPDGSISGTYVDGLGVTQTAFDISIDAGTGVLSYSQYVALEHGDTSDHNDSFDLSGLGITASATVTDSDGDSDSDSVDVGGQITIFDDGPVITSVSASNGFNVDETDVGPTVDGVFAAPLTGMSAGSVLDVDSDFGADGAGSLVYGLSLSGGGVTALTTAVGDFVITLVENPDGSISGTYVDGLGVTQTAFDISIDAGTGVLSYSQYVALEHGDTSDHNDSFDLSGLGITASATVTDSDGDSDSDSVDVGGQITIFDDGPVITSVSASNGFNVDETDVGPTVDGVFAAPLTGMSAGSVLDVDSDFGADGAGSLVYGLSLSGGGVTALTTAVGDFVITLVENPDGSISGTYVDGLGVTQTAFDISIDAGTGVLSYSQYVALEHGDTSDHNDSFDLSGLGITASATVTDSDGDSDSDSVDVGGQITIFDDGPVITSVSASNGFNVDETDVGPTVDGVFAAPLTGMSAGSVLDVDSDFGADGAGSLVYGLSLSGGGVTALTTAVGDFVITLVENPDGSISGTYVDGLGVTQTAFDISIDAGTGVLSYSQYVALEHGDTSDHNDSFDLSGLGITASATVTDSDGDSDSDSVDVGGQITIFDDGPVITSVSASNGFNVDETDVGPTVDGVFAAPLTGMSAGSVLDVDSDFGADGAGSLVYGLSLSGGGVTALTTAVGDFVITLVENPDGSISGTYVDGLGVTQTAFDISIDAGTGVLSYSQYVALEHGDTSDHNDSFDLSGLGITASATVTDSDGDSDSDSVDVGGQITIFDDGPVITSVSASNGFNVDETDVGPTVDGVFAAPLTGMSAGSVLDVDSDFGADGAGSLVYGLSLSGGGVTALTTAVGDFVITLVENPDGSISGTYVDGLGVTQTAFDISIDAGTGVLSYSQYVALEHGDTSDHNDSFDLSGLGITASATVTDSDGDSDSDSVDVGGQITIFDDGPVITSVSASNGFNVDETDVGPTVDGVFAAPLTGMSAGSVLDVDSDFGADGAGSLVYGLSLSGGGVTALTTAVGDFVITLVENPDGSISGTYVDGLGVTQTAFDISIDAGTGVLSYSQYVALEHGDTSDHNDSFDLSGLGITASATVTDSDGDSDSDSVDVGGQITIFDDGPVITSVSASNGFNVDETDVGPTVDGVFAAPLTGMSAGSVLDVDSDFGADGAGSLVYGLSLSGGGVTALTTAVGDFVITLVENPDGSISGTYVDGLGVTQTAFDISIDAGTGVLSYSQYVALEHGDTSDHNDSFDLSGLGITASATVTDSDGDSDSDSVDVGGQITIFDDGPVITSVSASNGFNVDETDVGPTVDGVFAAPLTGMSAGSVLDVDSDFGADGAGSLVYGLSLSGGGVTALTTAVGDFVITLVENPDGSISGTYVDGLGVTQTAFDISIDAGTGVLSYSQYVALEHGDTSDHNDSFDLSGLGITASATVTDSDGDSDSDSVDVGGQITIFDDGPVITSVSASNGFNVDETDVGPTVDGVFAAPLTGMSAGSVLDVDSDFGADGAGSLVYGLSLSGGGVTALTTAVGDFVITLVENPDGSISGTYVDGLGVTQTAFDISIDAGTGVLSYSQYVALEHGDTSDHNDSFDLSGLGITASATVTDSDGDSDSDSVDVGGQITIFDDGPVITSVSASNGFNVDETDVGPTVDGVFAAPLTGMSAGSVLDVDSDFGADGAGSLVYGLSLSGGGVTALTTAVGDFVITLVENPDGSISGTYVDGLGVTQTAFDISIDAGTGVLSYSQYVALEHGDTSDHNDSFDLSGLGITASATVTDSDGDSDSDSVDVGGQITIFDDGPVITSVSASNGFNVDETDVGPTVDGVFAAPLTGMSAGSVLDVDSDFGADGAGSLVYGLSLSGGGVTALTTAVGDFVITLVENPDGSISGTYVDGLGVTQTAFDISIDAGTGVLSYSQYVALEHGDTSDHNDSFDLSGLGITASATVTDSDGDSDSDSVDVGGQITIFDDGPVITSVSASNGFNVDETDVGPTVDGVFAAPLTGMSAGSVLDVDSDFGADGAGSLVYGLSLSGGGVTALTTAVGDFVITLVENPDGSISGTYVDGLGVTQTAFDISIDAGTGVLSYSQYVALEHGDTSDHNDSFDLSGLGITASATVTDSDGDSDSDSVDVGGQITIFDDGLTANDDADTVDEATGSTTLGNVVTGIGDADSALNSDSTSADGPNSMAGVVTDIRTGAEAGVGTDGTIGVALQGTYGTLLINADGSYTYTVTDPDGVPLGAQDIFTYTITDGDGDSDEAELIINVAQNASVPTITDSDVTVFEDGFADGEQHGVGSDVETGTFVINANGEAFTLDIGGTMVSSADLELGNFPAGITTTYGVLTITGYDELTGTVTYSYDLNDVALTHTGQGEINPITETIDISVTDATGDPSTTGSITVSIVDDIPTITASGVDVDEDGLGNGNEGGPNDGPGVLASASGVMSAQYGADGAGDISLDVDVTGLTSQGEAVLWDSAANVGFVDANNDGMYTAGTDRAVFNVTLDETPEGATGYTFNLVDQLDHPNPGVGNSGPATEDNIDLVFTATITDGDGDFAETNFTVNIDDDSPENNDTGAITITVEEDDLSGGNNEDGSVNAHMASGAVGDLAALVDVGADENISFGLVDATSAEALIIGLGLTTGGVAVDGVRFDGSTVYAQAGGTDVFSFTVNGDGSWSFELIQSLDHHLAINADDDETATLSLNLTGLISATDFDGDSITLQTGFTVNIEDDIPVMVPGSTGNYIDNDVGATEDFSLYTTEPFGADGPGSITFTDFSDGDEAMDANGDPVKLDGTDQVYLFGAGTDMLIATTDPAGLDASAIVYTVQINTDGTYTVDVIQETVFSGDIITVTNLSSAAGGGNVNTRGIGVDDTTNSLDVLISGSDTVNTNSTEIGIGPGQDISGSSELARFDFVSNLESTTDLTTYPTGFTYDDHIQTTVYSQLISWVQGNNNTTGIVVTAIDADNDQNFDVGTTAEAGESFVIITDVKVFDVNNMDVTGSVTITYNGDGSVEILGLEDGWTYQIETATEFSAVQVQGVDGETPVKLGIFSIGGSAEELPVDLNYNVEITDGDGDSVTTIDAVTFTIGDPPPPPPDAFNDNMGNMDNYAEFSFDGNHIGDSNYDSAANAAMALVAAGALTGQMGGEASTAEWVDTAPDMGLETVKPSVTSEPDQDYRYFENLGAEATEFAAQFLTEMDSDAGSTVMDAGEFVLPSMILCENDTDGNEAMLISEISSSDTGLELTAIDIPEIMPVVDLGIEQPINPVTQVIDSDFDAEKLLETFFDNSVDDMLENLSLDGTGTQESLGGGLSTERVADASALFAEYQNNEASHLGTANVESLDDAILLTATLLYI